MFWPRERENFSARKLQVAGSAPPAEEKKEVRKNVAHSSLQGEVIFGV